MRAVFTFTEDVRVLLPLVRSWSPNHLDFRVRYGASPIHLGDGLETFIGALHADDAEAGRLAVRLVLEAAILEHVRNLTAWAA